MVARNQRDALTQAGAGIAAFRLVGHTRRFRATNFFRWGRCPLTPRGRSVGTPRSPLRGREARCARLRSLPTSTARARTAGPGPEASSYTEPVSTHLSLPLDNAAIERILPHRYPFLLVDKITEFEEDKRIVGVKNVSLNERYLAHRPGEPPALPPTILTEAVAQVGAILILAKPENREKLIYFLGIEQVRFLKPVHPGDVVVIEATVERLRSRMGQLKGFARVGEERVVEGTMAFALGPRKDE